MQDQCSSTILLFASGKYVHCFLYPDTSLKEKPAHYIKIRVCFKQTKLYWLNIKISQPLSHFAIPDQDLQVCIALQVSKASQTRDSVLGQTQWLFWLPPKANYSHTCLKFVKSLTEAKHTHSTSTASSNCSQTRQLFLCFRLLAVSTLLIQAQAGGVLPTTVTALGKKDQEFINEQVVLIVFCDCHTAASPTAEVEIKLQPVLRDLH